MLRHENIIVDQSMVKKIDDDTLIFTDRIKVTLANFTAELFPDTEVYIDPMLQGIEKTSCFINIFDLTKQQMFGKYARYKIGVVISYQPIKKDPSSTELYNAVTLIQQHITDILAYKLSSIESDVTDGVANVTAYMTLLEVNVPTDPIIMNAERNIKI